jgi:stress response protein SCP2
MNSKRALVRNRQIAFDYDLWTVKDAEAEHYFPAREAAASPVTNAPARTASSAGILEIGIWSDRRGTRKRAMRFDLLVTMFDARSIGVDTACFRRMRSDDRSAVLCHNIENDDDEQVLLDLARVAPAVKTIRIDVQLLGGGPREIMGMVPDSSLSIRDRGTGLEMLRFDLSEAPHDIDSLIVGRFFRSDNGGWLWSTARRNTADPHRDRRPQQMPKPTEAPAATDVRSQRNGCHFVNGCLVAQGRVR